MCENHLRGTSICWTGACKCLVILALLQATQSLHHTATSAAIAGHTNLAAMRRLVARTPVGDAVQLVEDSAAQCGRHKRPHSAGRHVTQQTAVSHV